LKDTPQIGFHVSVAKSLDLAYDRAAELGCTTFQLFTRNPRVWKLKPLPDELITTFRSKRKTTGFRYVVDHMPYLPNLASSERGLMKKSRDALEEEVRRCDALGLDYLVVHLGSHGGKGSAVGMRNIADATRHALEKSSGKSVILLENMAGQKNCVGASFEELRKLLDMIDDRRRVGICLDTCHVYAAGFDLTSQAAVDRALGLFDEITGMKELKVVHLNDTKGGLGSHLDRHEHIGKGNIGLNGFRLLLKDPRFQDLPMVLETPKGKDLKEDKINMRVLRSITRG